MSPCLKCGIDEFKAPIHEHHLNRDHYDNRPENKILLCANCHMMLHWNRWKLSDVGLPEVERIKRVQKPWYYGIRVEDTLREEVRDQKEIIDNLTSKLNILQMAYDKRTSNLTRMINALVRMMECYNFALHKEGVAYVNANFNSEEVI